MEVPEPGRFQCPEQQTPCSFPSSPTVTTFQLCFIGITLTWAHFPFPAWLPFTALPQNCFPWHPCALGSSQSPGPCWDAGVGTSLSTLGWMQRGLGRVLRGAAGLWSEIQGELILPQQNHSAWRSWCRSTQEGENLGAPQIKNSISMVRPLSR